MSERMDELAKAMASGTSRRSVLRALWSGVVGVGAVMLLPRGARAASGGATADDDVLACIQENCAGLHGPAWLQCVLLCKLGDKNNSQSF